MQNQSDTQKKVHEKVLARVLSTFTELFGFSRMAAIGAVIFIVAVVAAAIFYSIHSAPPHSLTITTGPSGSSYERYAANYQAILAKSGVKLIILPSGGSVENLERLSDPKFHVDVGFVQTGEANDGGKGKSESLYSLGSIAYQPLSIYYRSATPVALLSDLAGKRLAIGAPGTGTRALATMLLATNGVTASGTTFLDLDTDAAAKGLLAGTVDAVFLMGDSASPQTIRTLLHAPGVQMYDFIQADAYIRKIHFLNKLEVPRGAVDFGKDIPSHDVTLLGPTVELVARGDVHPALCDLLLDAARETHKNPTLFQKSGEFPAPLEQDFTISPEAARYYKSGKSLLYRSLPFWLANLITRFVVAFIPMLLVLVPSLRLIPVAYKMRIQLHIYRWYRNLLRLERELDAGQVDRQDVGRQLDVIEHSVNRMKVPASFASQFYGLRDNIAFVRGRLKG